MEFIIIPKEKIEFLESSIGQIKDLLQSNIKSDSEPEWISKKDACQRLRVCTKTLDSYMKKGIIPFTQFKSKVYIKASDIKRHLEKYYVTKNQSK